MMPSWNTGNVRNWSNVSVNPSNNNNNIGNNNGNGNLTKPIVYPYFAKTGAAPAAVAAASGNNKSNTSNNSSTTSSGTTTFTTTNASTTTHHTSTTTTSINPTVAVPSNDEDKDQMVCAAMSILMCPPHEGIAREYHALPPQQQSQVWSDLTGSQAALRLKEDESIETVQLAITQLRNHLQTTLQTKEATTAAAADDDTPSKSKTPDSHDALAYTIHHYPHYVLDPSFLLKFLRAERFDIAATVQRMILHFHIKQDLFGRNERLGRDITLDDLSPDDLDAMSRGYMQVLPKTDFSGRPVLFYYKAISDCYKQRENILRTAWYVFNKVSMDESAQKTGIINVVYNNGGFPEKGMDYEKSRRFGSIMKCIPLRIEGMFVCLDEVPWLGVVEAFSMMVHKFLRIRLRALPGSHMECMYKLLSLGLPHDAMPVTPQSELIVDNHHQWMKHQHQMESMAASAAAVAAVSASASTSFKGSKL